MKESPKRLSGQMNLPLLDAPVTLAVPADKQKELTLTLAELLLDVAQEHGGAQDHGGEHE